MYIAYVDGGLPGNGQAHNGNQMFGSFLVKHRETGDIKVKKSRFPIYNQGSNSTNNLAEWRALLALVTELKALNIIDNTKIFMDSQLVINQYKGIYRINKPHLKQVAQNVKALCQSLDLNWIPGTEMKLILGH